MTWTALIGAMILYPILWRLAVVERATFRLPDRMTLPHFGAGLLWSGAGIAGWPWAALLGAGTGYTVFAAIGWGFYRWRNVDGLGLGDAKLLAAGGAWTRLSALLWIVLLAAICALAAALASGADKRMRIAFKSSLALAIGVCWSLDQIT